MLKIRLETHDGALVTVVESPPFLPPPPCDGLMWGSRFFVPYAQLPSGDSEHWIYREKFLYVVPA